MLEQGGDDGLGPTGARVVVEVIHNVAVLGSHEWNVSIPCVLDDIERCAVRHSNMAQSGAKVIDLSIDGIRYQESQAVSDITLLFHEVKRNSIVKEEDPPARVFS